MYIECVCVCEYTCAYKSRSVNVFEIRTWRFCNMYIECLCVCEYTCAYKSRSVNVFEIRTWRF